LPILFRCWCGVFFFRVVRRATFLLIICGCTCMICVQFDCVSCVLFPRFLCVCFATRAKGWRLSNLTFSCCCCCRRWVVCLLFPVHTHKLYSIIATEFSLSVSPYSYGVSVCFVWPCISPVNDRNVVISFEMLVRSRCTLALCFCWFSDPCL